LRSLSCTEKSIRLFAGTDPTLGDDAAAGRLPANGAEPPAANDGAAVAASAVAAASATPETVKTLRKSTNPSLKFR
jgi:hypothetical protein